MAAKNKIKSTTTAATSAPSSAGTSLPYHRPRLRHRYHLHLRLQLYSPPLCPKHYHPSPPTHHHWYPPCSLQRPNSRHMIIPSSAQAAVSPKLRWAPVRNAKSPHTATKPARKPTGQSIVMRAQITLASSTPHAGQDQHPRPRPPSHLPYVKHHLLLTASSVTTRR